MATRPGARKTVSFRNDRGRICFDAPKSSRSLRLVVGGDRGSVATLATRHVSSRAWAPRLRRALLFLGEPRDDPGRRSRRRVPMITANSVLALAMNVSARRARPTHSTVRTRRRERGRVCPDCSAEEGEPLSDSGSRRRMGSSEPLRSRSRCVEARPPDPDPGDDAGHSRPAACPETRRRSATDLRGTTIGPLRARSDDLVFTTTWP